MIKGMKTYRERQLEKLGDTNKVYSQDIKIVNVNGQTHWINLTVEEFRRLKAILEEE